MRTSHGSARVRALQLLLALLALAVGLSAWNTWTTRRDRDLALGPNSKDQLAFFVHLSARPDAQNFYKGMSSAERVGLARNLAAHDAPELPKLAVTLLASLDVDAREALKEALVALGPKQPAAVAEQLKEAGGFQRSAVFDALRAAGDAALPFVVEQLAVEAGRANAIAYLVECGDKAVPLAVNTLAHKDKNTRGAAADVLGKVRARSAVGSLTGMYTTAPPDERLAYLTALSSIADPSSADLLTKTLSDPSAQPELRSLAALGLGRIASPAALDLLWTVANQQDLELRDFAIAGLQLAGDRALAGKGVGSLTLKVAAGSQGSRSLALIASGLSVVELNLVASAAEAAMRRPGLVPALAQNIRRFDPDFHGDLVDALCEALASTEQGRAILRELDQSQSRYGAFAARRLALAAAAQ